MTATRKPPAGQVALVTGGAVRVGKAITLGLAEAGARVAVHYNQSADAAQETASQARGLGVEAQPFQADLASPEAVRGMVGRVLEHFGRVDILVHSASPFAKAGLFDVTMESWRQVMGVVVEGFLLLAQGLSPGMLERRGGAIVSILDRGAFEPWPRFLAHGTAKSTLWALTRSLAVDLAPDVHVNSVVPGPVLPPPGYTEETRERRARGTLLGRWGSPQNVVDAILFLIGSDYITGEALFVDGGERWAHRRGSR